MASQEEKLRRKAIREAQAVRELTALRESLPVTVDELAALIGYVEIAVQRHGCDHTLRHVHAFLARAGLASDDIVAWLNDQGGFCDCEVVLNVAGTLDRLSAPGALLC